MKNIWEWFNQLNTAGLLQLLEAAAFFDPQSYNAVFEKELEELTDRIDDEGARQEISDLKGFDFAGYILNSLKRAGIRNDDAQQEDFHQIAVKLLVSPGKLFTGWEPRKHGPLERRFRAATWNAIRNLVEKNRNRRKWMMPADPSVMADKFAGRQYHNKDILEEFRQLVAQRLGQLALAILDQRLSGEDTKNLVGRAEIGMPSAFYVKREVQAIKELAKRFAARLGESTFANMVATAMERQSATVEKRKSAIAAKSA